MHERAISLVSLTPFMTPNLNQQYPYSAISKGLISAQLETALQSQWSRFIYNLQVYGK